MRTSGVLMHISSLPSPYGIGTMGKEARKFADFLKKAGQKYWQILPICPTSYGDSPYQSFSSFAGNPYFIDLEYLCKEKLLTKKECESFSWGTNPQYVDYGQMYVSRYPLLKKAYDRFRKNEPEDFAAFCKDEAEWLDEYALFMALKDANGGVAWFEWEKDLKTRKTEALKEARVTYAEDIAFYKMLQYLFFKQWWDLKAYVNDLGIEIIGDVPIYVAGDSADVWANPGQFYLDEELNPIDVAGCPPDAFSADGQLWGNPLFRWDAMKKDGYSWWTKRVKAMSKLYDIVRIDHFRGFDEYYAIPYGDKTAERGWWEKGPGMDLFRTVSQRLGQKDIIAEDLGFMTDSVKRLVEESGYPNMKVIEFAFDARDTGNASDYLPHNYTNNCVVYTGTHDNETLLGWYSDITPEERHMVREYLWNFHDDEKGICRNMIRLVMGSAAGRCIIPIQDYLQLDNTARINQPSTLGINWKWRLTEGQFTKELQKEMLALATRFGRRNWTPDPVEEEDEEKEEA